MGRTLFQLGGIHYSSIVVKNIPKNMILETQKYLKDLMDSPGKTSSIAGQGSDCLTITYSMDNNSNKVSVVKNNLAWLMQNRQEIFYVDYSEHKLQTIITAFNTGDFSVFTLHKELSVETYSYFKLTP